MKNKKLLLPKHKGFTQKIIPLMIMPLIPWAIIHSSKSYSQFQKFQSPTQFEAPTNTDPEAAKSVEVPPTSPPEGYAGSPPPPGPPVNIPEGDDGDFDGDSMDGETPYGDFSNNEQSGSKGDDIFGHGSGIGQVKTPAKDKKYVNLNPETAFGPEVVTSFDFPNVSLIDLTKHMQKLAGINLIMEKDLKGKISIQAPTPITVGDAWKAYLTALNINGYTLVDSGAFYKIVNARDIRYTPTKIYTGSYTPDTENYVMRIIPLKNIDVVEVARSFRPFLTRYGRLIEIRQTNTLIIQDTGTNINRLTRLLKFLDVPGHDETLQIMPVKYSSAQEIAKLLDQLLKPKSGNKFSGVGTRGAQTNISKIIAEPRTNSIIAMANADGAKELRLLIDKLDTRSASNSSGQIHVYYLNYGDSESLSKTLSALVSGNARNGGVNRITKGPEDTNDALFNDNVKITADKDNNAIAVTASPTDWLTIKAIIGKLDIPRDQVYVEGMIMETQVNRGSAWGISVVGAYGSGGAQKAGFTGGSTDLMNLISNNITSLGGLFVGGASGKQITQTIGGQSVQINSINALITAIATNTDTNVLATPQILALDNTEATFEVGESVPIPKTTNTAGGTSSQTAIEQQPVTMKLNITPQINKVTRFIKLKIKQKIEDFSERAVTNSVGGVATTIRNAETTVVVRDRDTVAMGGLMRDKETSKITKVPLLGDIPIIGWLFKNKSKSTDKVNLLFFLTPKIMSSYQKSVATTVKDVLNRRAAHLKLTDTDNDDFKTTVKGLYEKANKQESGPLYDVEEAARYQEHREDYSAPPSTQGLIDQINENDGEQKGAEELKASPSKQPKSPVKNSKETNPPPDSVNQDDFVKINPEEPNYKQIEQLSFEKTSGVKR